MEDIEKEYLPASKKKIRALAKKYLKVKIIGGRMYVDRDELEKLLADPERERFPLD